MIWCLGLGVDLRCKHPVYNSHILRDPCCSDLDSGLGKSTKVVLTFRVRRRRLIMQGTT